MAAGQHDFPALFTIEGSNRHEVKWSSDRDKQLFPKDTVLTEDNCEPVLRMMAIGGGNDVFDVKLEKSQAAEGAKKK
ncbi:hypothetical protein LTR17_019023 [Elasticomyces elasticus]|nr:hypothetical protein LTR17_019023 [Elasticomyces elasticus]